MLSGAGRAPLFGPLPLRGIWTDIGLERKQFLAIVACSTLLFVGSNGMVWEHLRDGHLARIGISYLAIPVCVVAMQAFNRSFAWRRALVATAVIAVVKLLLTATLLVAIAIGQDGFARTGTEPHLASSVGWRMACTEKPGR